MVQTLLRNILKNSPVAMFKKISFLLVCVFVFGFNNIANANECAVYKITPKITIDIPEYTTSVVQPNKPMDLLHGNVVATLVNNYDIVVDIKPTNDGYCVLLKNINATIGYTDFLINVDGRHKKNSCSYNAIINHENMHIDAYLSVIDEYKPKIYSSLYMAANSVMPIFVKNINDIDITIDKLNNELQTHPDVVLIIQKIHAAEEIKNKSVDQNEDYSELKKCFK